MKPLTMYNSKRYGKKMQVTKAGIKVKWEVVNI